VQGVVWAADHGADVILMSFSNPGFSPALQDAIDYAWSQGAVVVAATGNDGSSTPTYPAGDAKVVGVSATDSADALWSGSNYGQATFVAAPGVGITADTPAGATTSVTGTSAAAALVAGAAALLKANGLRPRTP
jgi:thermitase